MLWNSTVLHSKIVTSCLLHCHFFFFLLILGFFFLHNLTIIVVTFYDVSFKNYRTWFNLMVRTTNKIFLAFISLFWDIDIQSLPHSSVQNNVLKVRLWTIIQKNHIQKSIYCMKIKFHGHNVKKKKKVFLFEMRWSSWGDKIYSSKDLLCPLPHRRTQDIFFGCEIFNKE